MQASKMRVEQLLVDQEDRDLEKWHWRLDFHGHVIRGPKAVPGNRQTIRLHRVIMERMLGRELLAGETPDHINRNKLDNRRANLRLATKSQNAMNLTPRAGCTSQFIGVSWSSEEKRTKRWLAYINVDGKRFQVGKFTDEDEAAWMRDQWAIALHDEFASLNFDYYPVA